MLRTYVSKTLMTYEGNNLNKAIEAVKKDLLVYAAEMDS